ncbi:hypothetical protein [Butyricicoccus sp. Marseille-Q5471]|uniref:hypothetical protein n=1 Tax=Butyricicoccus sp. Marseille-Q5471 TaxID=3039493 RepID=UPI0024BCD5E2|nr:hypothetical protein [Butyricicoccus sp. Marseille-Q5471]
MEGLWTLIGCLSGYAFGWLAFGYSRAASRQDARRTYRRKREREPPDLTESQTLSGMPEDEFKRELAEIMAYDGSAEEGCE